MSLSRLLRYVNILLAVALLAAAAAVYWFGYRVLPKTSGAIQAPLRERATVTRDAIGVPHIDATNSDDAYFLQGFVTAQDRLWQMEGLRRLAGGDLSEVVGRAALEADRESRRLRMRRTAEEHYARMQPDARAGFVAYARGVNYFIETHRGGLPVEFTLLDFDPRPWSPVDSVLAGMHMFRDLTTSWKDDVNKRALLQGGRPDLVEQLYPVWTGSADLQPGSNAWTMTGSRTASGKPILANDTHLQFNLPSTWYMVHLRTPQMDVSGVSLPGLPAVILGHNQRIAWGVTNLHFDVQDLYIERMNLQTGRYLFRGQQEQARPEREWIPIKGEAPVQFANWVTRHGPVWSAVGEEVLALKWTALEPAGFDFPFFRLNAARNWDEFRESLTHFPGPGQNFVYADAEGNIGYQAAGKLPIRRTFNGDIPVDGSSGGFEWEGYIPFEDMPKAFNPSSGLIVTANQNPFPRNYPYRVNGVFAPPYRTRQALALLNAHNAWKPEQMLAVQKDVYSAFSHFLARQVVAAYKARNANNPGLADGVEVLSAWNGQMDKDQPAPLLVALIYQHLRLAIAQRASPRAGQVYEPVLGTAVIERLLRERPAEWFPDFHQLLLRTFADAVEEGQKLQGRNVKSWRYGGYQEVEIRNAVTNAVPYVGRYFNIGPVPMSGSSTTLKQTTRRMGPSMRMVVDTSDWNKSLLNVTIGQSGQPLSSHYADQWDRYWKGESFPMRFSGVEGDTLSFEPR